MAAASFKVMALGHAGVGKTSLIIRYTNGVFDPVYRSTIGVDFFVKHVTLLGQDVDVQIWDTAGQERFRAMSPSVYRKVQGVLLVFDVCDMSSFRSVSMWMKEITAAEGDVPMILVGNKCDRKLDRLITPAQGREKADELRIPYFETSAREDSGVTAVFEALIGAVVLREYPTGLPGAPVTGGGRKMDVGKAAAAGKRPGPGPKLRVVPEPSNDDDSDDEKAAASACGC